MPKIKLIYNPHAGLKKRLFSRANPMLLQDIHDLLHKYEIEFETEPLTKPGDARRIAREAASQGYDQLLVAGGDGTVGEAATGLIGTNTALGILPLGTYMNVARMLSIPLNLESAIMAIKMGNVRSIDVGEIVSLKDEKVDEKFTREANYFLESVGIGLEADFQKFYLTFKDRPWPATIQLIKDLRSFYKTPLAIEMDEERRIESRAQFVMISNGPSMGANFKVAPDSKLNDHLLTVTIYKMSKKKIFWHLAKLKMSKNKFHNFILKDSPEIQTFTSSFVKVSSKRGRPIDADARIFGETPVSVKIKPGVLKVIVGFAEAKKESAMLEKKIYIRA